MNGCTIGNVEVETVFCKPFFNVNPDETITIQKICLPVQKTDPVLESILFEFPGNGLARLTPARPDRNGT